MANETEMEIKSETMLSPFCSHLRSKKYYFLESYPTEESHLLDQSNRCWCAKTMQSLGPDRDLVTPSECTASRGCYESLFAVEE